LKVLDASIVIPAYNESSSIEKTLALLSELEGIEFEVLVVVDSTGDSTIDAVKKVKIKLYYIKYDVQ
jgi:glycosyltransferase involved in cell wall biosynthesis